KLRTVRPVERNVELLAKAPKPSRAAKGEIREGHRPDRVATLAQEVDHRLPHPRPLRAALDLRVLVEQAVRDEGDSLHVESLGSHRWHATSSATGVPRRRSSGRTARGWSSTWCSSTRRDPSTPCCRATSATTAGASTPTP